MNEVQKEILSIVNNEWQEYATIYNKSSKKIGIFQVLALLEEFDKEGKVILHKGHGGGYFYKLK